MTLLPKNFPILRSLILAVSTFILGWLLPEMGWFSHTQAAWIIALAITGITLWLLTMEFIEMIPWVKNWKKATLNIVRIALCLMVFITSGIIIAKQPPKYDMEAAIEQLTVSVESIKDGNQLEQTFDLLESTKGIVESKSGDPIFLVPFNHSVSHLGDIQPGSTLTLVGLKVNFSPFLFKIPNHVYGMLFIKPIDNERYEVTLIATKYLPDSFKILVYIDSQEDITLTIPVSTIGFYKQSIEVPIKIGDENVHFENRDVTFQLEVK